MNFQHFLDMQYRNKCYFNIHTVHTVHTKRQHTFFSVSCSSSSSSSLGSFTILCWSWKTRSLNKLFHFDYLYAVYGSLQGFCQRLPVSWCEIGWVNLTLETYVCRMKRMFLLTAEGLTHRRVHILGQYERCPIGRTVICEQIQIYICMYVCMYVILSYHYSSRLLWDGIYCASDSNDRFTL